MLFLYDCVQEIHLKSKETIRSKRLIKKKTSQQEEIDEEEEKEIEDVYSTSLLYQSLQKRNGLICHDQQQLSFSTILDSHSYLSGSRGVMADHLTVLTSTNSSSTIRFEELCLILLRGVMERLSLQISPCQNRWTVLLIFLLFLLNS